MLLILLFTVLISGTPNYVFAEGSYQVGLNQSLYDYDSNDEEDEMSEVVEKMMEGLVRQVLLDSNKPAILLLMLSSETAFV